MPGLTARLLPAFLTQRRCAPLDFVTHTLFGRRHTAVAGVLWRLRVSYFDSFSRKSLFGSSRNWRPFRWFTRTHDCCNSPSQRILRTAFSQSSRCVWHICFANVSISMNLTGGWNGQSLWKASFRKPFTCAIRSRRSRLTRRHGLTALTNSLMKTCPSSMKNFTPSRTACWNAVTVGWKTKCFMVIPFRIHNETMVGRLMFATLGIID